MDSSDVSPNLFVDHLLGFQKTAALKAAIALDLFSAIGQGRETAAAVASRVNASERGVRILCDYLTVAGHLAKSGDAYTLSPSSAVFLDRASPACMTSVADFLASPTVIARYLGDPAAIVRHGGALNVASLAPEDPSWVTFAQSMMPFMAPVADGVAAAAATWSPAPKRILDIAAGHGIFGIALTSKIPSAQLTALDWPNVLTVARENATKAGLTERFNTIAGSAFDVDWGRDYDVVLLPNFLHHFDRATNESLLRRAHDALAPGGRVVVVEMVPNDDRVTPPFPAMFAFMMLGGTQHGDAYTLKELQAMAQSAQLGVVVSQPLLPSPMTMIVLS